MRVICKSKTPCHDYNFEDQRCTYQGKCSDKHFEIDGVGKDAPTIVNEKGAKQSHSPYRFDLIDTKAIFELTKVLKEGAEKYGEDNWRCIPVNEQLNHALVHIYAHIAGDEQDKHLAHAFCRLMFAIGVDKDE